MAGKIPVGATIARAYGFAFGHIATNIALIWVPVAILWVLTYLFYAPYSEAVLNMTSGEPMAALTGMRFMFGYMIVISVLLTAQIAILTKEALGLRTGSSFLQIPFGGDTWRVLGAYVLYFLVMIVIYVGCIFVGAIGGGISAVIIAHSGASGAAAAAFVFACVFAVLCALFYVAIRLSFFIAPVAIAEKRVSLIRAWQLGGGNFWRIFLISLSIIIPLLILEGILLFSVWGTSLIPPMHATPDQIAEFTRHQRDLSRDMMMKTRQFWYVVYPLGLVFGVIFYGLVAGASAFAYRALVPAEDKSTATPEA